MAIALSWFAVGACAGTGGDATSSTEGTSDGVAPAPTATVGDEAPAQSSPPEGFSARGLSVEPVSDCTLAYPWNAGAELIAFTACVTEQNGQKRRALDGAVVYPGEEIAFTLLTARPAQVRLLQTQQGVTRGLWPPDGAALKVLPGQPLTFPDAEHRFVLDNQTGAFSVFVIGSYELLSQVDPALEQVANGATAPGGSRAQPGKRQRRASLEVASKPTVEADEPVQGAAPLRERGVIVVRRETGAVIATPDQQGVALIEFRLDHRPRP